ncbi:MAG: prepilin-type N-terminal cleavage/methylation domain-containing protein [Armatimonadetes bacterium]|nr:prepilin-type N-terminal cleavage/methylation domain-containing protein [Armatimonadota bacterium]
MTRRRGGFTLFETLVALAVLSLLGVALVNVLSAGRTVQRGSSERLELHQRVRETSRRLIPLLAAAVPPTMTQRAVYSPDLGQTAEEILFSTMDDFLGSSAPSVDQRYLYRIRRIDLEVVLERMNGEDIDESVPPQVLARRIYGLEFRLESPRMVHWEVESRTSFRDAANQVKLVPYRLRGAVEIPYYSYR